MNTQSQVDVSITRTMIQCVCNLALGLCGLAAVIAFAFAAPTVIHGISIA
ncbi:MAG: hypothetical protein VB131_04870 [Burkholderia gladioli]